MDKEIATFNIKQTIQNAKEKAGVFINSYAKVNNNQLEKDEIIAFTSDVVKINGDVKYEPIPLNITNTLSTVYYRATVSVTIETDELKTKVIQWINKNENERSLITEKNNEIVRALDTIKQKNNEVKNLIANSTSKDDKNIQEELKNIDRATLYAKKIAEGNKLFKNIELDKAKNLYKEAIQLYPDNATIGYEKLGDTYRRTGEYDLAVDAYTKVIEMDSNYSVAYYKRGAIYYTNKDYSKANSDLKIAFSVSPQSSFVETLLIRTYFHLGNYSYLPQFDTYGNSFDKLKNLTNSLNSDINNASIYFERGKIYMEISNFSTWSKKEDKTNNIIIPSEHNIVTQFAINDFNRAIQISNLNADFYYWRGKAYLSLSDIEKALSDYTQAIKLKSDYNFYINRGRAYDYLKNYDAAIEDFNKAIKLIKESKINSEDKKRNVKAVYRELAFHYGILGDEKKSMEYHKKAN